MTATAVHIPNYAIASISLGTGAARAYFAGLDQSIHELSLNGQPMDGFLPTEAVLTGPSKVKKGTPFAAVTIGVSCFPPCLTIISDIS